ncbi:ankyrin repeat-containing domain protein [Aspergillus heterothallicus]
MSELLQQTTCAQLLQSLNRLPKGLPAVYDRIVMKIEESDRQMCSLILLWASLAARPLTVSEFGDAVYMQGSSVLTREQIIRDHITLCGPLLVLRDDKVYFVHQSIRDYLLRTLADPNPRLDMFHFQPEKGHCHIARKCLDYLEEHVKGPKKAPQPLFFLQYAAQHWAYHAQRAGSYAETLYDMNRPFFQKDWKTMFQSPRFLAAVHTRTPPVASLLHLASFYGLTPLVRNLLGQKNRWYGVQLLLRKKDADGCTPLHISAAEGQIDATELLLAHGANFRTEDRQGQVPLVLAALGGHDLTVQLLLRHGADIHHVGGAGTPLMTACMYRNLTAAKCLIAHGAEVNYLARNITALRVASCFGVDTLVDLLLTHGADINRRGVGGGQRTRWNRTPTSVSWSESEYVERCGPNRAD